MKTQQEPSDNKPPVTVSHHHKARSTSFHRARRSVTFFLLFTSVLILLILGVFQRELFVRMADIIQKFIWPALIAILTLFGFVVGGIVKNPPKSFSRFLDNAYLQIAVLEIFLFVGCLTAYAYFSSRRGEIALALSSGKTSPPMRVLMIMHADSTHHEKRDTVSVPSVRQEQPGNYTFRVIEQGFYPHEKNIVLHPAETLSVVLEDKRIGGKLRVRSDPDSAEIWIDGSLKGHTPATFDDLGLKSSSLVLRHSGCEDVIRSLHLEEMPEIDLGVITLRRLFTVTFDCLPHLRFTINGETYEGTTKGVRLPGGKYTITFPDQPGQKIVHITHDCTILVP